MLIFLLYNILHVYLLELLFRIINTVSLLSLFRWLLYWYVKHINIIIINVLSSLSQLPTQHNFFLFCINIEKNNCRFRHSYIFIALFSVWQSLYFSIFVVAIDSGFYHCLLFFLFGWILSLFISIQFSFLSYPTYDLFFFPLFFIFLFKSISSCHLLHLWFLLTIIS